MREDFQHKQPGDSLSAKQVNELSRVARQVGTPMPGSFLSGKPGAVVAEPPPMIQFLVIGGMAVSQESIDADPSILAGVYGVKTRYWDGDLDGGWADDADELTEEIDDLVDPVDQIDASGSPYEIDVSQQIGVSHRVNPGKGTGGDFNQALSSDLYRGDPIAAIWDQQQGRFVTLLDRQYHNLLDVSTDLEAAGEEFVVPSESSTTNYVQFALEASGGQTEAGGNGPSPISWGAIQGRIFAVAPPDGIGSDGQGTATGVGFYTFAAPRYFNPLDAGDLDNGVMWLRLTARGKTESGLEAVISDAGIRLEIHSRSRGGDEPTGPPGTTLVATDRNIIDRWDQAAAYSASNSPFSRLHNDTTFANSLGSEDVKRFPRFDFDKTIDSELDRWDSIRVTVPRVEVVSENAFANDYSYPQWTIKAEVYITVQLREETSSASSSPSSQDGQSSTSSQSSLNSSSSSASSQNSSSSSASSQNSSSSSASSQNSSSSSSSSVSSSSPSSDSSSSMSLNSSSSSSPSSSSPSSSSPSSESSFSRSLSSSSPSSKSSHSSSSPSSHSSSSFSRSFSSHSSSSASSVSSQSSSICGTALYEWDGVTWFIVSEDCTGICTAQEPLDMGTIIGEQQTTNCI